MGAVSPLCRFDEGIVPYETSATLCVIFTATKNRLRKI